MLDESAGSRRSGYHRCCCSASLHRTRAVKIIIGVMFSLVLILFHSVEARANDVLNIMSDHGSFVFSVAELLARKDLVYLDLSKAAEPLGAHVAALPLQVLLGHAAVASFSARDGFVARIPLARLMSTGSDLHAWIAVEARGAKWQVGTRAGIGPFALVWTGKDTRRVGQEQWVDSLVSIVAEAGTADPAELLPIPRSDGDVATAQKGRELFSVNCMPCHQLAGQGPAHKGPDLAIPYGPSAYLTATGFRMLVRNPGKLRDWPARQMGGFSSSSLSDSDIDAVWKYLQSIVPSHGNSAQ